MRCTCDEYQCPCHEKLRIAVRALQAIEEMCVYDARLVALDALTKIAHEPGEGDDAGTDEKAR